MRVFTLTPSLDSNDTPLARRGKAPVPVTDAVFNGVCDAGSIFTVASIGIKLMDATI